MEKKVNEILERLNMQVISLDEARAEMRILALFDVSGKGCSDISELYRLSVKTPYPINDIIEFMMLSGIKHNRITETIEGFAKCGVSNLIDVNTLVKMGHFNCHP